MPTFKGGRPAVLVPPTSVPGLKPIAPPAGRISTYLTPRAGLNLIVDAVEYEARYMFPVLGHIKNTPN